jgi:hypothetical protein
MGEAQAERKGQLALDTDWTEAALAAICMAVCLLGVAALGVGVTDGRSGENTYVCDLASDVPDAGIRMAFRASKKTSFESSIRIVSSLFRFESRSYSDARSCCDTGHERSGYASWGVSILAWNVPLRPLLG